jgi:two-component system response regulator HupR/HoxA
MKRELKGFSNAAMDRLVAYAWPGNVRELANEIERIAALAGPEETIGLDNLSEHVRGAPPRAAGPGAGGSSSSLRPGGAGSAVGESGEIADWDLNRSVDALKRRMLIAAVHEAGSKSRAAEKLGIPRQSLQKMVKRLEISEQELAAPPPSHDPNEPNDSGEAKSTS